MTALPSLTDTRTAAAANGMGARPARWTGDRLIFLLPLVASHSAMRAVRIRSWCLKRVAGGPGAVRGRLPGRRATRSGPGGCGAGAGPRTTRHGACRDQGVIGMTEYDARTGESLLALSESGTFTTDDDSVLLWRPGLVANATR